MPARRQKSKLYTRAGDGGETSLPGGRRLRKDHPRVVACGALDELNSVLGVSASLIRQRKIVAVMRAIQSDLLDIGAELASETPAGHPTKQAGASHLDPARTRWLESLIDEYDARVSKLQTFILPSGATAATAIHVARAVARRGERDVVALASVGGVSPAVLAYLNRLSDLLFILARYVNKAARRHEIPWRRDA